MPGVAIVCRKSYLVESLRAAFPGAQVITDLADPSAARAQVLIAEPTELVPTRLDNLRELRLAQGVRAGYEMVDLAYLERRSIAFSNARGLYSVPIAEDIVCKILVGVTNTRRYLDQQACHVYQPIAERRCMERLTVGFAGVGSIARAAARRLKPFGCRVVGWRRRELPVPDGFDEVWVGPAGWCELLSQSDVLVLAVDLNASTRHLLDASAISQMKPGAMVVNIARGGVVDEVALVDALRSGKLAYAALDVFEIEPLPDASPLWDMPNVLITPHASGCCEENHGRLERLVIENVTRFLHGGEVLNRVV